MILDRQNGGYGKAMNAGMRASTGEFFAILEPDDYYMPTMLEKLYDRANKDNLDFIRSDYKRFVTDEHGNKIFTTIKVINDDTKYNKVLDPANDYTLFNARMENWTGIYRLSFLRKNNISFNESPGAAFQDNGFWFQTYCWAHRIEYYNEAFYCYRTDNSASSINQTNKVFVMLDEYQWIESWLRRHEELCKQFIGVFYYKKTHNCEFAFSRLADQFQLPFLKRYAEEYQQAFARGEVDESLFWPEEIERLKAIVENPEKYLSDYRQGITDAQKYQKALSQGKTALFKYYLQKEGLLSTLSRSLKSILHKL